VVFRSRMLLKERKQLNDLENDNEQPESRQG
jgi:hypothetical protein